MNSEEFWKILKNTPSDHLNEKIKKMEMEEEEEPVDGILADFAHKISMRIEDDYNQLSDRLVRIRLNLEMLNDGILVCGPPKKRWKYKKNERIVSYKNLIRATLEGLTDFYQANRKFWRYMYFEDDGCDVVIRLTNRKRTEKPTF